MLNELLPWVFREDQLWIVTLIVIRVGAAIAFLPAFGEQVVPMRLKLSATLAFSAVMIPLIWTSVEDVVVNHGWVTLLASEVIAGAMVGFVFRSTVFALQIAGTIVAQSTSLSQFFGGGLGSDPQPAFSTLFVVSGLCLAVTLGLHVRALELLLYSYESFPPGHWPAPGATAEWVVLKVSFTFGHGFALAGPFVLASLIYNLGLGVINKAMPQLMVALVGAPAISFGGLLILFVTCPIILSSWGKAFISATRPLGSGF
ncbi:MAG: flagellar biosynthetic protein FliR [Litoreibacter sp.]|uniref:flagellar biosynthetic protein FliR n=1 Tax=Litoreibacter sp. TaxID=1969459 RepID=UPI00329996C7